MEVPHAHLVTARDAAQPRAAPVRVRELLVAWLDEACTGEAMSSLRQDVARAHDAALKQSFCTSCQTMALTKDGGYRVMSNGRRRFACARCNALMMATRKERGR